MRLARFTRFGTALVAFSVLLGCRSARTCHYCQPGAYHPSAERSLRIRNPGDVAREQLKSLFEEAANWVVATAPSLPQLDNALYKKILVVGGTPSDSRSFSQEKITAETRALSGDLQSRDEMTRMFEVLDWTDELETSVNQFISGGPVLDAIASPRVPVEPKHFPDDVFVLKMEFVERHDLSGRAKPPEIEFALEAHIEWGRNGGHRVSQKSFARSLMYETSFLTQLTGESGKWVPAE